MQQFSSHSVFSGCEQQRQVQAWALSLEQQAHSQVCWWLQHSQSQAQLLPQSQVQVCGSPVAQQLQSQVHSAFIFWQQAHSQVQPSAQVHSHLSSSPGLQQSHSQVHTQVPRASWVQQSHSHVPVPSSLAQVQVLSLVVSCLQHSQSQSQEASQLCLWVQQSHWQEQVLVSQPQPSSWEQQSQVQTSPAGCEQSLQSQLAAGLCLVSVQQLIL
ncbi:hypothetical protein [Corynebacterium spheniscorum]|uniref:hypothetical protein n=1 Tax=Corynebacterium spheniscorum TaxID=185761 RepID=UPI0011608BB0|nr:hypothetical protein [Corynebacterium spheniscorum]KAA8719775.1 hypothetical protein F4V56_09330 [Corynebacterium spheniscorum]